jgi:hypothetical protein
MEAPFVQAIDALYPVIIQVRTVQHVVADSPTVDFHIYARRRPAKAQIDQLLPGEKVQTRVDLGIVTRNRTTFDWSAIQRDTHVRLGSCKRLPD